MSKIETLKLLEKKFRNNNSSETQKIMFSILTSIKREKGLRIEDVSQLLFELTSLKRETVDHVIQQIKYKQKLFGSKHINYLRQTIQNIAAEPKVIYVSSKLRVNI